MKKYRRRHKSNPRSNCEEPKRTVEIACRWCKERFTFDADTMSDAARLLFICKSCRPKPQRELATEEMNEFQKSTLRCKTWYQ